MNREQIIELFIRACETDRKLPQTAKPKPVKAMSLPYVHSFDEMVHWGAERLAEASWLNPANSRVTRNDVGIWLVSTELVKLCRSEKKRRALWAWSRSQAGSGSFARWCQRVEGISRQLGDWRKNAAISEIELAFASKALLHIHKAENEGFTDTPEISHKTGTVEAWRDVDAKPLAMHFDTDIAGLEWADIQNARRRERRARRQQAA